MTDLLCPTCGKRFTGTCINCEMNARRADDMKHMANYNYLKMKENQYKTMTDEKLKELYDRTKIYNPGMGAVIGIQPEPLEEKPKLKVFQIKVYEGEFKGKPVIANIILILSTDLDTAFSQCGYQPDRVTLEGKELKGPFKSGFIMASWDD